jgi:hypothetical protein
MGLLNANPRAAMPPALMALRREIGFPKNLA